MRHIRERSHALLRRIKTWRQHRNTRGTTMKFTKAITVSGALGSHFVFTCDKEKTHWIENELPKLKAEYGNVDISNEWDLPGFEIGDTCRVWGEGDEEFVIEDLKCYSPYRYGFLLNSGWYEEVAKCYLHGLLSNITG